MHTATILCMSDMYCTLASLHCRIIPSLFVGDRKSMEHHHAIMHKKQHKSEGYTLLYVLFQHFSLSTKRLGLLGFFIGCIIDRDRIEETAGSYPGLTYDIPSVRRLIPTLCAKRTRTILQKDGHLRRAGACKHGVTRTCKHGETRMCKHGNLMTSSNV